MTWSHSIFAPMPSLVKKINSTKIKFTISTKWWVVGESAVSLLTGTLNQRPEQSCGSTQAQTWRCSQHGQKISSQDADSQIPATHLWREVAEPRRDLFFHALFCILPLVLIAVSILAASLSGSKSIAGTTVGNLGSFA